MTAPGRSCPIAYQYHPEHLATPAEITTSTLYVAGGLYGNPYALEAILARADSETLRPEIVFNGDFHYLDADRWAFGVIAEGVLAHRATLGNVEYALTAAGSDVGCGCDYPDYVADSVVDDSNGVVARLQLIAFEWLDHMAQLSALPRYLTVDVGGRRIGVVHGDPENLAGWRLALEAVEPADAEARRCTGFTGYPTTSDQIVSWCQRGQLDVLCCTHTGLPYAQDFADGDRRYMVANNGCAGLPNFSGTAAGVLTRLSVDPVPPADSLYGIDLGELRFDAIPVAYDQDRWLTEYRRIWPPGTPGHRGYHARITRGTWLTVENADRLRSPAGPHQ